jgi:uncharacterized membrane protein YfcA
MDYLFIFEMLLLGLGVGLMSGALGLGGGILMVPAFMTFVPGMDAHTAKGTSLFIIIFVSFLNAVRHMRDDPNKPWNLMAVLATGSVIGGYFGAWVTGLMSDRWVVGLFMILLAVLGYRTFFIQQKHVDESQVRQRTTLSVLLGFVTGIVSGATGTGGGAVLIPLALMAGIVTNERVVGLSNMVMVITSIAGSVAHFRADQIYDGAWTYGQIDLALVPLVFIGAQLGSPPGKWLNQHLTLRRRRVAMGVLLLIIAVRLGYRLAVTG